MTAESTAADIGEHYAWVYWDAAKRAEFVWPLLLAESVEHQSFLAYGLDEGRLEQLLEEIQNTGRGSKGRQSFEILCTAIQSKDEKCPTAFIAGQGLQISKRNFGTLRFIIVAILWSNTSTFTFLLMEHGDFDSLDELNADTSEGICLLLIFSLFNSNFPPILSAPPLFKVRHQELTQFLTPSIIPPFQDIHSSLVEEWTFKERTTNHDKEKIISIFMMDWWTSHYKFGLKRQPSITPGNILVELKARADARVAAERVAEGGSVPTKNSKRSKRQHSAGLKSKLSDEEVKERAALTLQALGMKTRKECPSDGDQLDSSVVAKRLRGGGADSDDPVINDPRYLSMQQQMGDLQAVVAQLLDAKV